MKIVLISDTHGMLNEVTLPQADLLIHSGDATSRGLVPEIIKFNQNLESIKHLFKYGIIFVPGNHDWLYERHLSFAKELTSNATVLVDETIRINGYRIFGSPWQPAFNNWAFNLPRGNELKRKWEAIPDRTDVLITHGPPKGILDTIPHERDLGCEELRKRVNKLNRLKLHVFGHIHGSYGQLKVKNTTFINASVCTEDYKPINQPIIFDLP